MERVKEVEAHRQWPVGTAIEWWKMIYKNDIKRIPILQRQIEKDCERLAVLREMATAVPAIRTDRDKITTSRENKAMAVADKAVDLDRSIAERREELGRLKAAAREVIQATELEDAEREAATLRYVKGLLWREVADIMHYHVVHVERLCASALFKIFG